MGRSFILSALFLFVSSAFAQEVQVPGYDGVFLADLTAQGNSKEKMFRKMQHRLIKEQDSICANRAHMWSFDFQRFFQADSAKVFIFYTPKTSRDSADSWWYHVAPVVNDEGKLYAMDGSFFDQPIKVEEWVEYFAKGDIKKCYEIKNEDADLIKLMFNTMPFPKETSHGKFDCYYKIVPATIWFPIGIAFDLLGTNQKGDPILFTRNEKIPETEALEACIEASETDHKDDRGNNSKKARERCEKYLGATEPGAVKLPF